MSEQEQPQQVHYLYLDLNSFFASCEQQERPELRGRPIAVVPMLADTTFCLAASYEAKAFGVKTGVRVADAKKMCPGLLLIPAQHSIYVRYHHKMIEAVESCIPVHAVCSIDEIACELTGSQKNPAVAQQIAGKIKVALKEQVGSEIKGSIGLGPNMLLAKIAADMQKPDGLTTLTKSILTERLSTLGLKDIPGIGKRMEARLYAKGIMSVAQLLQKTEQELKAVWGGIHGPRMYHLLRGADWSVPAYFHGREIPKSIGHEHVLPPKERNPRDSLIVALRLLSKAAVRLRDAKAMATGLRLSIRSRRGEIFEKATRFHETQDTSSLMKTVRSLHKTLNVKDPLKIGVVLFEFVPELDHQLSLFENERRNEAFRAVDKINQKYGRDTIYVGSLHDHRDSAPTRIAFSRIPDLDELD